MKKLCEIITGIPHLDLVVGGEGDWSKQSLQEELIFKDE